MNVKAINDWYHLRWSDEQPYQAVFTCDIIAIFGWRGDGTPIYEDFSGPCLEPAESVETATAITSGHVRFDACSNWSFSRNENVHFCSHQQAAALGEAMAAAYEVADDVIGLMDGWRR